MHRTRLIIGLFLGLSAFALAATFAPSGLVRFYGDSTLTNLTTGAVYFNTSNSTFWVGGVTSNPVMVGTVGVASTNDINTAVAGYLPTNTVFGGTTNLSVLDLSTNSMTLYFTNGLFKGVSSP